MGCLLNTPLHILIFLVYCKNIVSVKKKIIVFFSYIILIIYSLEFLSSIFLKKKINLHEISIDQIRNEKTKSIKNFDRRKDFYAFNEEKNKNSQISPSFKFSTEVLYLTDFE